MTISEIKMTYRYNFSHSTPLMYKVLSAFLQPLSDKRITDGINGVARAAVLYYCVMRDSAILFFIVIAIVCASTSFIH